MRVFSNDSRSGRDFSPLGQFLLVLACALLGACSVAPDGADVAEQVGITKAHLRVSKVEEPIVDPGNVLIGGPTLEAQKIDMQMYQDALFTALKALAADSAGSCSDCPILSSRILAIVDRPETFPSRTELTVLFKLSSLSHVDDPFWWKVITRKGSSIAFAGVMRVRHAREDFLRRSCRSL